MEEKDWTFAAPDLDLLVMFVLEETVVKALILGCSLGGEEARPLVSLGTVAEVKVEDVRAVRPVFSRELKTVLAREGSLPGSCSMLATAEGGVGAVEGLDCDGGCGGGEGFCCDLGGGGGEGLCDDVGGGGGEGLCCDGGGGGGDTLMYAAGLGQVDLEAALGKVSAWAEVSTGTGLAPSGLPEVHTLESLCEGARLAARILLKFSSELDRSAVTLACGKGFGDVALGRSEFKGGALTSRGS